MTKSVPTEHIEQIDLFRWLEGKARENPIYSMAYAQPNGGKRHIKTALDLKNEGVKAGIPDVFFPVARYPYHGLYIEMKRLKGGAVSPEQKTWIELLTAQGYQVAVCQGHMAAIATVESYFSLRPWA